MPKPRRAIAIVQRAHILQRVARGDLIDAIAADLHVSGPAISQQLASDPEYRAARQVGALTRLEQHYGELRTANDALTLARARETFRAASWFAEREFPDRWAPRPPTSQQGVAVTVQVLALSDSVVGTQQIAPQHADNALVSDDGAGK